MSGLFDELMIALHGVWNRRWLALAVAWGICMLGWLVVALIPNSYESRARVYVQTQSILPGKIGITPVEQQQRMDRVRQTLASADNLEKVVRGTDLAQTIASDRDMAGRAASLREHIKVVAQQDNLFEISTIFSDSSLSEGANAKIANQIVQKLIDIFQEENIAGDRDETRQTLTFLDAQIASRGTQLQAAQQRQVEFQQKYMGLLPGSGSISDRMNAARTEINGIDSQLVSAQGALAAMNGQLAGTPASIPGMAVGGGGNGALISAQGELAAARARGWTANHPDVIALQRQIAALRAQGGGRAASGGGTPNPAYLSIRSMQAERAATVSALQARKGQIEAELNAMTARQADEPGVAAEQERLDRDYAVLKTQYDKLLADREDIRLRGDVQNETDSVKFRVIDPPSMPSAPAAPNRALLLIAVLIVGIGGGVGAAFAMGQLRATYATAAQLEKATGLPVIGSITQTVNAAQRALRRQQLRWFCGASGALGGVCLLLIAVDFVQRSLA